MTFLDIGADNFWQSESPAILDLDKARARQFQHTKPSTQAIRYSTAAQH
jgi:hypothetical protein